MKVFYARQFAQISCSVRPESVRSRTLQSQHNFACGEMAMGNRRMGTGIGRDAFQIIIITIDSSNCFFGGNFYWTIPTTDDPLYFQWPTSIAAKCSQFAIHQSQWTTTCSPKTRYANKMKPFIVFRLCNLVVAVLLIFTIYPFDWCV